MDRDEAFFAAAIARMHRWMAVLSVSGTALFFGWQGWQWGCGFALGAAASWLNFRWLKMLVDSLGVAAAGRPAKKRVAVLLGLRYLLAGAAGYVILRFTDLSLTAALIGLFVSAAAVIVEILYQLVFYAGT
jgi:ATP synthase I subunit